MGSQDITDPANRAGQGRLDALAERKADLEVKNLRSELLLRPFGLLTPLILAIGVYFLVHAPSTQMDNSDQCLREIAFVQSLTSSDGTPTPDFYDAMGHFPFSCQPAKSLFDSLVNMDAASTSLRGAESASQRIGSVTVELTDGSNDAGPVNQCLARVNASRSLALMVLNDRLMEIDQRRLELLVEHDEATSRLQAEIAGLGESGLPGCGPNCERESQRVQELERESATVRDEANLLRGRLETTAGFFDQQMDECRPGSGSTWFQFQRRF